MDYEISTADAPPPNLPNKQGFRFHKSGSVSPIPPPPHSSTTLLQPQSVQPHQEQQQQQLQSLERIPSHPTLISEAASPSYSSEISSTFGGRVCGGNGAGSEIAPLGVDPKLFHIVKRITSCTPSLLISSSGNYQTMHSKIVRVFFLEILPLS
jgi:hypothetical protein